MWEFFRNVLMRLPVANEYGLGVRFRNALRLVSGFVRLLKSKYGFLENLLKHFES
jgi:hypothetical protein